MWPKLIPGDSHQSLTQRSGPLFDYKSIYSQDDFKTAFKYQELKNTDVFVDLRTKDEGPPPSRFSVLMHHLTVISCWLLCLLLFPITVWMAVKRLKPHERLVIFRLGRLQAAKGPGLVCVLPRVDHYQRIDTRTRAFNVPPQKVFTNDNAVIEVGADVHFHVVDAVRSVLHVQDLSHSVRGLGQLTLMNSLSKIALKRIQGDRLNLGDEMKETMNETVWKWGIEIDKFEMSHVTVIHNDPPMNAMSRMLNAVSGNDDLTDDQTALLQMMGSVVNSSQSTVVDFTSLAEDSSAPVAPPAPPEGGGRLPGLSELAVRILKDVVDSSVISELQAVYRFNLSGDAGGVFHLDAKYGYGSVGLGPPLQAPDVTLTSSCEDFHRLMVGEVNPLSLYMSGRLLVEGDLAQAMKLDALTQRVSKLLQQRAQSAPAPPGQGGAGQYAQGFIHHV